MKLKFDVVKDIYNSLSLRKKILLGFLIPVLLLTATGGLSYYQGVRVEKMYSEIYDARIPNLQTSREIRYYISGQANDERGFLLTGDDTFVKELHDKSDITNKGINKLLTNVVSESEKSLLYNVQQTHEQFTNIQDQVVSLYKSGKIDDAKKLSFGEGRKTRKSLDSVYQKLDESINNDLKNLDNELNTVKKRNQTIIIIFVLFSITIAVLLSIILSGKITNPIKVIIERSKQVANGDLSGNDINVNSRDEIGELSEVFNEMIINTRGLVGEILNSSQIVSSASEEISSSTGELANSAKTQTASTQELNSTAEKLDKSVQNINKHISDVSLNITKVTESIKEMGKGVQETVVDIQNTTEFIETAASSVEEMNVSLETIADNSKEANKQAEYSVKTADEGRRSVDTTIEEMKEIDVVVNKLSDSIKELGDSANQIGEIINVIRDIAEQTNMLALNAAIEAARAGEHGKGFAVVADAIRDLAEKSSMATKDIGNLVKKITESVNNAVDTTDHGAEKIREGVQLVKNTGESFEKIYSSIKVSTDLIGQIASSIEEQSKGSQDITKAVERVSNLIQNLSAVVQEQSAGVENIIEAANQTSDTLKNVLQLTGEQLIVSKDTAKAAEVLSTESIELMSGIEGIASAAQHMVDQSSKLTEVASNFKVD